MSSLEIDPKLPTIFYLTVFTGDRSGSGGGSALQGQQPPSTVVTNRWLGEYAAWQSGERMAVISMARASKAKRCILVRLGATTEAHKKLVGFTGGVESAQDWRDLLLDRST